MKKLIHAEAHQTYQVKELYVTEEVKKHLNDLGLVPGSKIVLLKTNDHNGIVLIQNSRIALGQDILAGIFVEEVKAEGEIMSLAELGVGETAKVVKIFGEGAVRRRLMDMGLTKNVPVTVRKLAPFGDPLEIHLRGYELTLRKSEADFILVEREAGADA